VHVVNSTTVTAVTPAHAIGVVDVVINTPSGGATLPNGYTYVPTTVGQPSGGGIIACLGGGLNNLIAAFADNSTGIPWGGQGIITNATSDTDGAANTIAITTTLGAGAYAAQLCSDYQIDSQNNTPCQPGNTCYQDWFLPAGTAGATQLPCLYNNRVAIGGFDNVGFYWSSTESNATFAKVLHFTFGAGTGAKSNNHRVRCVRAFTP
jgi:hypothetical protein